MLWTFWFTFESLQLTASGADADGMEGGTR